MGLISCMPLSMNGQSNFNELNKTDSQRLIKPNLYPPVINPEIYLQIDESYIKLDTASIKQIQANWIKKVIIAKEEKYKKLFGEKVPVLLIIPKKKFKHDLSGLFDKK